MTSNGQNLAAKRNGSTFFQEAFNEYCCELASKPKKKRFIGEIELSNGNATPEELQEAVETLVKQCEDKKLRQFWRKYLTPVVNGLDELSGVITGTVQVVSSIPQAMPLAIVWGGLKFLMGWAKRFNTVFEQIQSELETLSEYIFRLSSCEKIYSVTPYSAPSVQRILAKSYKTILLFWYRVTKELKRKSIGQLARSIFPSEKLKKVLDELKENADALERACDIAEKELQTSSREVVNGISTELAAERIEAAIERAAAVEERKLNDTRWRNLDEQQKKQVQHLKELLERQEAVKLSIEKENAARVKQERENRRRLAIHSIRGDSNRSNDLLRGMITERHPSSCEWLFRSPEFQNWSTNEGKVPVFWLNGRHGAGKSFLCAAAIEKIRQDARTHHVAIQFLRKGMEISKLHIIQNLAYQLTRSLEAAVGDVPDELIARIEECKDDTGIVETLIPALLSEVGSAYIFIDGLDEISNQKEIEGLAEFLIQQATEAHGQVRLWFGSQPLPQIEGYLRKNHVECILEKFMHIADTEADIKSYFASAIPESFSNGSTFAKYLVQSSLETEVEGSFLWASSMISDLKEKAEDADDMIRLAQRRLPTRMDEIYRAIIGEYKNQDRTRRLLHSDLPLWRIILSLLTYTKRPLRLLELREAVAMLRSSVGEDLSNSKFVSLLNIRKECSRLVRFIQAEDNEEDGTLELNHSAVFAFLQEEVDMSELESQGRVVSPNLICDLCIKYLSQPRYSQLLRRKTYHEFITWCGEDISNHQLLLYAAKYWYRHCDERTTCVEARDRLKDFLYSPNFRTLLQIQSVSIIGHFLLSFNEITGQPRSMKKILPACVRDIGEDTAKLAPQFNEFLYEWSELLQFGLTSELNGEIDRCFWKALGPSHFLRHGEERYNSFHFTSPNANEEMAKKSCFYHVSSVDGRELVLAKVRPGSENDNNVIDIIVERWCINSETNPTLVESESITVSCEHVQWSAYSTPCSRKLPFVPQSTAVISATPVSMLESGCGIRLGSLIIMKKGDSPGWHFIQAAIEASLSTPRISEESSPDSNHSVSEVADTEVAEKPRLVATLRDYCEEMAHRANWVVVCRRRIPKPSSSSEKPRRSRRRDVYYSSGESSGEENHDSDDEDQAEAPAFSDSGSLKSAALSDDLRLASEDSGSSDEHDEADVSVSTEANSDGFDVLSDSDDCSDVLDSNPSSRNSDVADSSDASSLLSAPTSDSSSDEVNDMLEDGHEDRKPKSDYEYPVGITNQTNFNSIYCDRCEASQPKTWFYCPSCPFSVSSFDICHQCIKDGDWCYDKRHQLYELVQGVGVVEVISWDDFLLGQEILVFDTDSATDEPTFTHSMSESTSLHQSAPVIHPNLPLVVWPISAEKLLFVDINSADISVKKRFMLQPFKASTKKARQISIDLRFSPCGGYLHVGSVEATRRKVTCPARTGISFREKHFDLTFHVVTMRLSPSNPVKGNPTIISRQCHALGVWTRPFISVLPYSWTWTPGAVFFTMTGFKLRVYRIPLPSPATRVAGVVQPSRCTPALIMTPSETIILPRSARERTVQFFPPPGPSDSISTVIIGPRYGPKPSPPIGVSLSENDLGPWINVHDKEGEERMKPPKRRFTGAFEEFDEDDDCDIIPFDDGR